PRGRLQRARSRASGCGASLSLLTWPRPCRWHDCEERAFSLATAVAFSSSCTLQRPARHRGFRGLRPSLRLEAKGLHQLLHVLDLLSHKPAHLLRRAAGDNVAVFGQLRDQLWSMGCLYEFPI